MAERKPASKPKPKRKGKPPPKVILTGADIAREAEKQPLPRGRPTLYTPELADEVIERLTRGESLKSIGELEHMPHWNTIRSWVAADRDGFAANYYAARDIAADLLADDTIAIADAEMDDPVKVARARLRVDTRKWYAGKLAPKRYGDKLHVEGEVVHRFENLDDTALNAKITAHLQKMGVVPPES